MYMYDKYLRARRAVGKVPECRYLSVCRSRGCEFYPDKVPRRLICLPFLRPLKGSTIGADEAINDRDVQTGLSQYWVHMR